MKRKIKVILKTKNYDPSNGELLEHVASCFPKDDITIIQSSKNINDTSNDNFIRDSELESKIITDTKNELDNRPTNNKSPSTAEYKNIKTWERKRITEWIAVASKKGIIITATQVLKEFGKIIGGLIS